MNDTQKLTFNERKQTNCPVCQGKFYREDLLSGGGRLIAGELTAELRRVYEPSKKYGEVHPLVYSISVCPVCYYSALPADFSNLSESAIHKADTASDARRRSISLLFPSLDYHAPRTLREGLASYFFAMQCYELFDRKANPTFKAGLCALRGAWLAGDLQKQEPDQNWGALATLFYRKARFYYRESLERESGGQEPFEPNLAFGPDLDKNYGYHGVIYLSAYLDYRHGPRSDAAARVASIEYARRMMAKVFGMGKTSKNRPSALLDKAKEIYEAIGVEVEKLQGIAAVESVAAAADPTAGIDGAL